MIHRLLFYKSQPNVTARPPELFLTAGVSQFNSKNVVTLYDFSTKNYIENYYPWPRKYMKDNKFKIETLASPEFHTEHKYQNLIFCGNKKLGVYSIDLKSGLISNFGEKPKDLFDEYESAGNEIKIKGSVTNNHLVGLNRGKSVRIYDLRNTSVELAKIKSGYPIENFDFYQNREILTYSDQKLKIFDFLSQKQQKPSQILLNQIEADSGAVKNLLAVKSGPIYFTQNNQIYTFHQGQIKNYTFHTQEITNLFYLEKSSQILSVSLDGNICLASQNSKRNQIFSDKLEFYKDDWSEDETS